MSNSVELPTKQSNSDQRQRSAVEKAYARLCQHWSKFAINPYGSFYYGWLMLLSFCYAYNVVFLVARASFWLMQKNESMRTVWFVADYLITDALYLVDIFVRCTTSFMLNGELCKRKQMITRRYLASLQCKVDIVSVLPTDVLNVVAHAMGAHNFDNRLLPALRLNRLAKLPRLLEFRYLTETLTQYPTIVRMSNLIMNILIVIHWNACIYFVISNVIGFGTDLWVFPALTSPQRIANMTRVQRDNTLVTHELDAQYVYCFWWSVLTLTTIAEVPQPKFYYQQIYMYFLLMLGVIILAITIGSASDMIENANRDKIELQRKCDYTKSFLKQNHIGGELERRVLNYLNYLWITPDVQSSDILNMLPGHLRKEIAMNIHIETLKRVHVFQDCEPGLLEELVTKLKLQIYTPGDYVCRKGDVGHEMYFIKNGKLQVVSPDGSQVFATLGAGAAFGEISILDIAGNKNGNKRTANIRSLGFSNVYQLSKSDLWSALTEYPKGKQSLLVRGKAMLKKDNLLDEEIAVKEERKQLHLHEQVEHFKENSLAGIVGKLDQAFVTYAAFVEEVKIQLAHLENKIGF